MPQLIETLIITDGIPGLPSTFAIPLPAIEVAQWEADLASALIGGSSIDGAVSGTLKAEKDLITLEVTASEDSATMPASFSKTIQVKTSGIFAFATDALLGSAGKQFMGRYTATVSTATP